MAIDLHRQAEELMGTADHLSALGDAVEAQRTYRRAAELEVQAFDLIPEDRPKTRGVIAVSAVALFKRAGDISAGTVQAHRFLALSSLPDFATNELYELVDDFRVSDLETSEGRQLAADEFECVLDGPRIQHGVAGVNTVIEKIDQVAKLGVRVYEYLAGARLRTRGAVDPDIQSGFDMLVSQPVAGSFKFRVRFATLNRQIDLSEGTRWVEPTQLTDQFASILDSVGTDQAALSLQIPDPAYRSVFMKLVRDLAPTGKDVDRVEIHRVGGRSGSVTVLTPPMRNAITKQLRGERAPSARESVRKGVLRALHLNERWIAIGGRTGKVRKCFVRDDETVLEEVVARLVNKPVRVSGYKVKNAFYLTDIVEDDESSG